MAAASGAEAATKARSASRIASSLRRRDQSKRSGAGALGRGPATRTAPIDAPPRTEHRGGASVLRGTLAGLVVGVVLGLVHDRTDDKGTGVDRPAPDRSALPLLEVNTFPKFCEVK